MVTPKALVLHRDDTGTLRIRADFDIEVLEPAPQTLTISRQMENVALSALVVRMSEDYDAIFALLNQGIPPPSQEG